MFSCLQVQGRAAAARDSRISRNPDCGDSSRTYRSLLFPSCPHAVYGIRTSSVVGGRGYTRLVDSPSQPCSFLSHIAGYGCAPTRVLRLTRPHRIQDLSRALAPAVRRRSAQALGSAEQFGRRHVAVRYRPGLPLQHIGCEVALHPSGQGSLLEENGGWGALPSASSTCGTGSWAVWAFVRLSFLLPPSRACGSVFCSAGRRLLEKTSRSHRQAIANVAAGLPHTAQGPPTIAPRCLIHHPDKIARRKAPMPDIIRTKSPKFGGRSDTRIRTNGDVGVRRLILVRTKVVATVGDRSWGLIPND